MKCILPLTETPSRAYTSHWRHKNHMINDVKDIKAAACLLNVHKASPESSKWTFLNLCLHANVSFNKVSRNIICLRYLNNGCIMYKCGLFYSGVFKVISTSQIFLLLLLMSPHPWILASLHQGIHKLQIWSLALLIIIYILNYFI